MKDDESDPDFNALAIDEDGAEGQDPGEPEDEAQDGVEQEPELEDGQLLLLLVLRLTQTNPARTRRHLAPDADFSEPRRTLAFDFGILKSTFCWI